MLLADTLAEMEHCLIPRMEEKGFNIYINGVLPRYQEDNGGAKWSAVFLHEDYPECPECSYPELAWKDCSHGKDLVSAVNKAAMRALTQSSSECASDE